MLEILYPTEINPELVQIVQTLSQLLKLPDFTSTFGLEASHQEILGILKKEGLMIRFINSKAYNANLVGRQKDCYVEDEYGWFDYRVSRQCVNINYDFYTETKYNLHFLKVLALVTAIHELQHFLRAHLKERSPVQPIPSLSPPQTESGDSWEVRNLGGRLGILSHSETKDEVFCLYLTSILNGEEIESLIDDSLWTQKILWGVSKGCNVFPLGAIDIIHPIPDTYLKGKVSHKCQESSEQETTLAFDDIYYKHKRPNDKLGRKDS